MNNITIKVSLDNIIQATTICDINKNSVGKQYVNLVSRKTGEFIT